MSRSPAPVDGRCQLCQQFVGRANLVWDHCHDCGLERGWTCHDCNMAMTVHLIHHWTAATSWLFERHQCPPQLFALPVPSSRRDRRDDEAVTRKLYLGQGRNDGRYVRISKINGMVTFEQVGPMAGVTPGTARDQLAGRRQSGVTAVKYGTSLLIPTAEAVNYITERHQST